MQHFSLQKIFRILTGLTCLAFVAILAISYLKKDKISSNTDGNIVPVISQSPENLKEKPEDEGGMDIPFKETEIYSSTKQTKENEVFVVNLEEEKKKQLEAEKPTKKPEPKKVEETKEAESVESVLNEILYQPIDGKSTSSATTIESSSPKDYKVQLGSFGSYEIAKSAWEKLKTQYPETLKGLSLEVEPYLSTSGKNYHRVKTSPISKERANKICEEIKNCLIVKIKK